MIGHSSFPEGSYQLSLRDISNWKGLKQRFNPYFGGEVIELTIRWMAENSSTNVLAMAAMAQLACGARPPVSVCARRRWRVIRDRGVMAIGSPPTLDRDSFGFCHYTLH